MELKEILNNIDFKLLNGDIDNLDINAIHIDSRKIQDSDLFICIRGANTDGHKYIDKAIEQGASAIVVDEKFELPDENLSIPIIQIEDTRNILGDLALNFYGHPEKEIHLIGITGTKGKTTTAKLIQDVLEYNDLKAGSIGTMGIDFENVHYDSNNTTPDPLTLARVLREMVDKGVEYVVMEASSQGFKHNRLKNINFDYGIFLNIDQDHIGEHEHEDFEDYLNCKLQIFNQSDKQIVNSGDKIWNYLDEDTKNNVITFAVYDDADYSSKDINYYNKDNVYHSSFNLNNNPDDQYDLIIPGDYNIENALSAIALSDQLGLNPEKTKEALSQFTIFGRNSLIESALPFDKKIIVDMSHNRISMKKFIESIRNYSPGKIINIYGIGWEETKMRRYDVGLMSGKYADLTIVTSVSDDDLHNKDTSLDNVAKDIIQGIEDSNGKYLYIPNRYEAIRKGMELTQKDDTLIITDVYLYRIDENGNRVLEEEQIVDDILKKYY